MINFIIKAINFIDTKILNNKKYSHDYSFKELIRAGYIILARNDTFKLSNLFISGYWKHAIFCINSNYIVEATANGVVKNKIEDTLSKYKYFIILKPLFASDKDRLIATRWVLRQVGKQYDYYFSISNEQLYCSELIYHAYSFIKNIRFNMINIFDEILLLPNSLKDNNFWEVIYDSRSRKDN